MRTAFQKYRIWILVASLALNLFFIGQFAAMRFNKAIPDQAVGSLMRGAIMQLSPEGRQKFQKAFLERSDLILESRDAMIEKRLDMLKKMGEPELSIEELNALMAETRDLASSTHKGLHALLLQTTANLSAEDRKRFSNYMIRELQAGTKTIKKPKEK
tara:strand:+ start:576 stop:1049 length:474 start_codon:yes stop_codon:yes gene_type:complete